MKKEEILEVFKNHFWNGSRIEIWSSDIDDIVEIVYQMIEKIKKDLEV
jgi:hypothetical protein